MAKKGGLFFGGVPTEPDVHLLLERYGRPVVGQLMPYTDIGAVIHSSYGTSRFRTVTNQWRRAVYDTYNLVVGCQSGEGFIVLNESERLDCGARGFRSGFKRIRKSSVVISGCDNDKLTFEERKRKDFVVTLTGKILAAKAIESRKLSE